MLKRSLIDDQIFERIICTYNLFNGIKGSPLQVEACSYIKEILVDTKSLVIHDACWMGFLIIFFGQSTVYLNPWFFGGKPFGNQHHMGQLRRIYLEEAKDLFEHSNYKKMLLLSETNRISVTEAKELESIGLNYQYDYVNMVLELDDKNLTDFTSRSDIRMQIHLEDIRIPGKSDLINIFHQAFSNGDARFYNNLTEEEKGEFFDELGYEQATLNHYSRALYYGQCLIGFSLAYEVEEKGLQISCMCIVPEFIHRGFGKLMLEYMIQEAIDHDLCSIYLGTETTMSAYIMYQHYGFKTLKTVSFYLMKTF